MNNHTTQYDISRELPETRLNAGLISMQIRALRESLRRLEDHGVDVQLDLKEHVTIETHSEPDC